MAAVPEGQAAASRVGRRLSGPAGCGGRERKQRGTGHATMPLDDQTRELLDRMAATGAPVVCSRYDGTIHGFLNLADLLGQGKKATAQVVSALRSALAA